MKKEKIISEIKTAGVVAAAVVGLGACGPKQTQIEDAQTMLYKTDSAASVNPEYKNTTNAIDLYEAKIQSYKDANKNLIKYYAKDYIKHAIKSVYLSKILLAGMEEQILMEVTSLDADESIYESTDIDLRYLTNVRFFRRNKRWYNDLVMYLSDKYNEKQFLNGDFFNVVKNAAVKETFEYNTRQIEHLQSVLKTATNRQETIYENLWRQYSNGKQRKR